MIRWNEISGPNFGQANSLFELAQKNLTNTAQSFSDVLKNYGTAVETNNTNKLLDYVQTAKTPDQFQEEAFQQNLANMRAQYGNNYDREKIRSVMDTRLGKLQADALAAQEYTDKQDAVFNRPHQAAYYLARYAGDQKAAAEALSRMRGNTLDAVSRGLDVDQLYQTNVKNKHSMAMDNKRFTLEETNAKNDAAYKQGSLGLQRGEALLKLAESFKPEYVAGINPDTGQVEITQQGGDEAKYNALMQEASSYFGPGESAGTGSVIPQSRGKTIPQNIRNGILQGESGGDYNALLGYSNRGGGKFSNVKLTDMSVDQAIQFSMPGSAYANWSKSQVGKVATPMGAYQIVGTTLRNAKKALGLKGNEKMTPQLQDRLADYIYQTQGTKAWVGYKGPRAGGVAGNYAPPPPGIAKPSSNGKPLITSAAQLQGLKDDEVAGYNEKIGALKEKRKNSPLNVAVGDVSKVESVQQWSAQSGKHREVYDGLRSIPGFNRLSPRQKINLASQAYRYTEDNIYKYRLPFTDISFDKRDGQTWSSYAKKYAIQMIDNDNWYDAEIKKYGVRGRNLTTNINYVNEVNKKRNK